MSGRICCACSAWILQDKDETGPDGIQGLLQRVGRSQNRLRGGHQESLPEAGAATPSRFESGDKAAEAKFKDLNEANEVLGDPEKRKKYDELGANWRAYEQAGTRPPGPQWQGPAGGGYRTMTPEEMQEMFGEGDPFSDFFHTFFGGGGEAHTGARARGRRGRREPVREQLEAVAELTLDEAFRGTHAPDDA